jgi:hypothetical protein
MKPEEIVKQTNFVYKPADVSMRFSKRAPVKNVKKPSSNSNNSAGGSSNNNNNNNSNSNSNSQDELIQLHEDVSAYNAIVLSSVPRKNDPFFPVEPFSDTLALWAQHSKLVEKKKKLNQNSNANQLLMEEPQQTVLGLDLTAANRDSSFKIMVDGVIYGPYSHVRIVPVMDPVTKQTLTLPIQTFTLPDLI